jgi:hypothetical protein
MTWRPTSTRPYLACPTVPARGINCGAPPRSPAAPAAAAGRSAPDPADARATTLNALGSTPPRHAPLNPLPPPPLPPAPTTSLLLLLLLLRLLGTCWLLLLPWWWGCEAAEGALGCAGLRRPRAAAPPPRPDSRTRRVSRRRLLMPPAPAPPRWPRWAESCRLKRREHDDEAGAEAGAANIQILSACSRARHAAAREATAAVTTLTLCSNPRRGTLRLNDTRPLRTTQHSKTHYTWIMIS